MAPLLILRQSSASTSLVKQAVEHTLDGGKLNILVLHDDNIPFDWHKLQKFLCAIYVAQLSVAYAGGAPLFDCNVVFEKWCGYDFGLEKDIDTVYVSCQAELERVKAWNLSRAQAGLPELVPFQLQNTAESSSDILSTETAKDYEKTFPRVAVGGTFDHLHAGHKILLTMTALIATESMVVGVTDDSMLTSKKFKEQIESIETRLKRVQGYLQLIRRDIRYEVVPISDPFGPTITDSSIVALVCSEETEKGGEAVNKEREKRGFPPLDLRIIDVISSDNASVEKQDISTLKISSTWIREYLSQIRNR